LRRTELSVSEKPEGEVLIKELGVEPLGYWSMDAEGRRRFIWFEKPRASVASEYNPFAKERMES
jgi:hypothetical protein